jgi:hypothetical protein
MAVIGQSNRAHACLLLETDKDRLLGGDGLSAYAEADVARVMLVARDP